jgi:hypothetical protein
MAALAAMLLAHQAPRPIRAAEVRGAMHQLVHDAGGPVMGAHPRLAARAADRFVPADGLVGFALATHHTVMAEAALALGGAGGAPHRMRGAHHLAANAARPEAGAAGGMIPGAARAGVRRAMRQAARGTGPPMRVAGGLLIDVTRGDALPVAEPIATHPTRLPTGAAGHMIVMVDQQLRRNGSTLRAGELPIA